MLTQTLLQALKEKQDATYDTHTIIPVIFNGALYYIFDSDETSFSIVSAASTLYGDDSEQLYDNADILSYEIIEPEFIISHDEAERLVNQALLNTPRPCKTFLLLQEHELNYYITSIVDVDTPDAR